MKLSIYDEHEGRLNGGYEDSRASRKSGLSELSVVAGEPVKYEYTNVVDKTGSDLPPSENGLPGAYELGPRRTSSRLPRMLLAKYSSSTVWGDLWRECQRDCP